MEGTVFTEGIQLVSGLFSNFSGDVLIALAFIAFLSYLIAR